MAGDQGWCTECTLGEAAMCLLGLYGKNREHSESEEHGYHSLTDESDFLCALRPGPFIFLYDDDFLCEMEDLTRELSGTFQL